ncbi:glycosyltransferase [Candidatus Woesearchaeota archaeon]|nr:glycosyltransferase [Candidatus Woesearchaeota archaeon]
MIEKLPYPPKNKKGWPWTEESASFAKKMPNGDPWPKITIVTPSFNQEKYLEATIRSVLLQNYPNLEYIIIDGGSTDNSVEIIRKYSKFVTFWISEKDNGHGHALNKGFSKSTGEIMAWINSDDMYHKNAFLKVANIFSQHNDINWITGKNSWWDKEDNQTNTKEVYKNKYNYLLGYFKWIQQESVFWRKSLWEKAGARINENYKLMVDGELWCRFFLYDDLWHVDKLLSGYRTHGDNRAGKFMKDVIIEMKKAIREFKSHTDKKTLYNAKTLQKILIENNKSLLNKFYNLKEEIDYNILVAKNNSWIKKRKEFTLKSFHEIKNTL